MWKEKKEKIVRISCIVLCELFALASLIMVLITKDYSNLAICIGTFALVWVPTIVEKLFSCKINLILYVVCMLYTICPILGDCYKLYYVTSWWDKLLHTLGGVVFAIFGAYLFELLTGKSEKILACAVFALCFSIAISACWEFYEFGSDMLFGTDMQHDTVITSLHSYELEEEPGIVGHMDNIQSVLVNGEPLPVNGYLDTGVIDSMMDMLFESAGALVFALFYLIDRGKHPLFVSLS